MRSGKEFAQNKILVHGDHVKTYLDKGYTYAPVTMEIDLTNRCNNKCPGCTGYKADAKQMPYELATRLIREFGETGVRGLIFTGGGEPLLHPNTSQLVEQARNEGMDVGFITSGQRPRHVTDDNLETIIRNATWLRVSLDAGSPHRYLLTHGLPEDNYYKALEFIRNAVEAKERTGSSCTIGVGYLTGLGDKLTEQRDIHNSVVSVAQIGGVDYFQLRPFHNSDRGQDFAHATEIAAVMQDPNMKLLASDHKYKHMDDGGARDYDYCHGARFASVVCANGKLYACCHARNQDWGEIADLNNRSFQDVWNSEDLENKVSCINVHNCIPRCRADNINRSVQYILEANKNGHKNFL